MNNETFLKKNTYLLKLFFVAGAVLALSMLVHSLFVSAAPQPPTISGPATGYVDTSYPFDFNVSLTRIYNAVASGDAYTCAISSDNLAYCWGYNSNGQQGNGTANYNPHPLPVAVTTSGVLSGLSIKSISVAMTHSCAIASDDLAYCWGFNGDGRLGDNSTIQRMNPVAVSRPPILSGKTFKTIAVAGHSTCAIASDNLVYCWGSNISGELGIGVADANPHTLPLAVDTSGVLGGGKTIKSVVAGGAGNVCTIASDNQVYCWGHGQFGLMGNGSTADRPAPVAATTSGALSGLTIKSISSSDYFTCVIASDNKPYCWGYNVHGELGNGTMTPYSSVPVPVYMSGALNTKTVKSIAVGDYQACVIASDDKAYCWGYNGYGNLGNASTTSSSVPVPVYTGGVLSGLSIKSIESGDAHTCAIASDDKTYCWGRNNYGQLGENSTTNSSVPVGVQGIGVVTQLRYGIDWDMTGTIDQWVPYSGYASSGVMQQAVNDWAGAGVKNFQVLTEDNLSARSVWATTTITITNSATPIANYNMSGFAWSETVGWIGFSCTDTYSCDTSNFGVSVSTSTGALSGYAWSENVGWITFNTSQLGGCPSGTCSATLSGNLFSGWAKVLLATTAGIPGWDGFISLSGTTPDYSVTLNATNHELEGYAWGSNVVGWVSFNHRNCDTDPEDGFSDGVGGCPSFGVAIPGYVVVLGAPPIAIIVSSDRQTLPVSLSGQFFKGSSLDTFEEFKAFEWYRDTACTGTPFYSLNNLPTGASNPTAPYEPSFVSATGTYEIYFRVKNSYDMWSVECRHQTLTVVSPQCSDGVDNDGDALVDNNDAGCHTDYDVASTTSYDPDRDNEFTCGDGRKVCDFGETFGTCPYDCYMWFNPIEF